MKKLFKSTFALTDKGAFHCQSFFKKCADYHIGRDCSILGCGEREKNSGKLKYADEKQNVIIISHRLKSIENVDQIVVIEAGEVEACGKHKDLTVTSKTYRNLVEKARLAEVFKY